MNQYSWLQKKLHQIALSSQLMREVSFDVENSLFSKVRKTNKHVFITGLARSGTTILLNAIYKSDQFASLTYKDMPFILSPNLWGNISFSKGESEQIERAHEDGIKVSKESPEAFEEVFWKTFDENEYITSAKFKNYIDLINHKYKKNRYLSKNNQNIKRIKLISEIFPTSQILIPFREPIQHANSLLIQHIKFIKKSNKDKFIRNYMFWIGHTEFGPNYRPIKQTNIQFKDYLNINHWIEQWILTYKYCYKTIINKPNISFISYQKLCTSKKYWHNLNAKLDLNTNYNFKFKESKKNIYDNIDEALAKEASELYMKLSNIDL